MKYVTALGCSLLGVLGLGAAPRFAHAQEPGAAPVPPGPAERAAAAPAPGADVEPAQPDSGVPPSSEPGSGTAVEPTADPSAPPAPEASVGSAPAPSADEGQAAAVKPEAHTSQIPAAVGGTPEDEPAPQGFSGQLGRHQDHWIAWLGVRNDYVRDANFDLFADDDALTVFSVGAGRTVWTSGNFSLAALGLWEIGSRRADIRGNDTSLRVQRFQVAPEGRYHLHYRVYGFARLGIGAEHLSARFDDELHGGELVSKSWAFAGDLAGGAAVQVIGLPSGEQRTFRAWVVAEGGYALASSSRLSFEPADDDASIPERAEPAELGELNLSAPFIRLALRGTY